jgi:hypothetical protein
MAITGPLTLATGHDVKVPPETDPKYFEYLIVTVLAVATTGLGMAYLVSGYLTEWWYVCRERGIWWFQGVSALSLTVYLLVWFAVATDPRIGVLGDETVEVVAYPLTVRTVFLLVLALLALIAAAIETVEHGIKPPKLPFRVRTDIPTVHVERMNRSLIDLVVRIATTCVRSSLLIYKHLAQLFKAVLYALGFVVLYVGTALFVFMSEFAQLVWDAVEIFIRTLMRFALQWALPVVACALLWATLYWCVAQAADYIRDGTWQPVLVSQAALSVFTSIIALVWAVGDHRIDAVLKSLVISNLWLSVFMYITTCIAWLVLYAAA